MQHLSKLLDELKREKEGNKELTEEQKKKKEETKQKRISSLQIAHNNKKAKEEDYIKKKDELERLKQEYGENSDVYKNAQELAGMKKEKIIYRMRPPV